MPITPPPTPSSSPPSFLLPKKRAFVPTPAIVRATQRANQIAEQLSITELFAGAGESRAEAQREKKKKRLAPQVFNTLHDFELI